MVGRRSQRWVRPLTAKVRQVRQPFRPRARVLQLLGDELIGNSRLAVFELVKNAYDADANEAVVRLDLASAGEPTITVSDDGEGMTLDTLRSVWLVPGDDHRQTQRRLDQRTPRHGRLPLGEKGLGRFAVHKLGNRIRLVTRAEGSDECVVNIDWSTLIEKPYLDQAPVTIKVRRPKTFANGRTGTYVRVRGLRTAGWRRGEVRRLHNQITSICSPFKEPSGFRATLQVPGLEHWIEDLPEVSEILNRAIWRFSFSLKSGKFDWSYEFRQVPGIKLDARTVNRREDSLQLPSRSDDDRSEEKVVADEWDFDGIGPIAGEFYVYDRDREVRRRMANLKVIEDYLDEAGGVRVYRDGIRVYNYGEQGDDWLGLDLRRVNVPTRRISRNIIIGAIHLSLRESHALVEKTNREGFVDNPECQRLRRIVIGVLHALETERRIDKDRLRQLTSPPDDPISRGIRKPLDALRREVRRHGMTDRFEPYVAKIEHDFRNVQETLLSAGMSGLNLAVIFHEVERGVRMLHQAISEGVDRETTARQARDLTRLLDGFATLLRRDSKQQHSAYKLLEAVRRFNMLRFRYHEIDLRCPLLEAGTLGFHSRFTFNLVLGALNNLVDNSLYWLRVRWPEVPKEGMSERKLFIGTTDDLDAGPAIFVADNAVGFQGDSAEEVVRPFFTRKPDGMGLGLYYSSLAMELNGGQLAILQPGEVDVPRELDGAVVALVFGRTK